MSKGWEVDGGRAGGPVRKGTKSCKGRRRKRERRGGRGKRVPHPPQQPRCAGNDDSLRLTARRSDRCQTVVVAAAVAAADEDSADEAPATKMRRNAGSAMQRRVNAAAERGPGKLPSGRAHAAATAAAGVPKEQQGGGGWPRTSVAGGGPAVSLATAQRGHRGARTVSRRRGTEAVHPSLVGSGCCGRARGEVCCRPLALSVRVRGGIRGDACKIKCTRQKENDGAPATCTSRRVAGEVAVPHGPRGRSRCAARRQHARVGRVWADSFGTGRGASWHKLVGVVDSVGPTRGHCAGRARPRRRTARSVNGRLQSLMRSLGPVRGQIQPSASIARLEQSSRNPRCVSLVPPSYKRLDLLSRPIHLSSGRTS